MKAFNKKNTKKTVLFAVPLCLCAALWGNTGMIFLKANLAKILIANAWRATLSSGQPHKPWAWADTWPVGKLYFPRRGLTLYILSGAHGSALAFGPGHLNGTALPSEAGTKVIGGHRDTHFKFLNDIDAGEMFLLQSDSGSWHYYRMEETKIADIRDGEWQIQGDQEEIHFITCYPFDTMVPGGPLRFIAIAKPLFEIPAPASPKLKVENQGTNLAMNSRRINR